MEMHLRTRCQKLRVVEKLNGAHFHFPQANLAVRVYYPDDVKRFDAMLEQGQPSSGDDIQKLLSKWHGSEGPEDGDDLDGLHAFRNHFKFTAVICVLPQGNMVYLDRPDSFIHRVQQIMGKCDSQGGKVKPTER